MQQVLEIERLAAKRADLATQLEILTNRRGQLADQISRTETEFRAAPRASLELLDARIARLEKEAAANDDRISELRSLNVEQPIVPPAPAPPTPPILPDFGPVFGPHFPEVPHGFCAGPGSPGKVLLGGVGFVVLTAILCRWTWLRAKARFSPRAQPDNTALQHAVDAIAIEVERISEGQRFVTNLLDQRLSEARDVRAGESPRATPKYKSMTPV